MSLGSIIVRLTMNTADFETDTKRAASIAKKRAKEIDAAFRKAGTAIGAALGAGLVAAGTALVGVTKQAIDFGEQIAELSNKTGVGAETLSGWAYAADQSGASMEQLAGALPKLAKNLAGAQEEGSRLSELFKTLGVETTDAAGRLRSVDDVLPEIADRFKSLNNETLESALAMEVFGRSGSGLVEFLNNGSSGLDDLTQRARELGVVISDDAAASADEFKDRLGDLKALAMALGIQIADRLLPALIRLIDDFSALVKEGDLATKTADGFVEAVRGIALTSQLAVDGVQALANAAVGLYSALDGVMRLTPPGWFKSLADGGSVGGSFADAAAAFDAAKNSGAETRFNLFGTPLPGSGAPSGPRSADQRGSGRRGGAARLRESMDASANSEELERLLGGFLANPTGGAGGGAPKESEAEKAAKRLQEAYESTLESLERQKYLLGQTGEAAQLRYETELGSLAELDPLLKQELLTKALLLDAEIAASEEAERQAELDKRATEAFEDMNKSILEQIELIGMSADEQEIFNALTWLGVDAESARGQEIIGNIKLLQKRREEMEAEVGVMDDLRDAGKGFLQDLREGANPLQAVEDALDRIIDQLSDRIFDGWIDGLLGKQGDPAGGSIGGGIWDFLGGLFGGPREKGGPVQAGMGYLVGEKGPEWFQPSTAGSILPADKTARMGRGGRGGDTFNFVMPTRYDLRTQAQVSADVARVQQRAVSPRNCLMHLDAYLAPCPGYGWSGGPTFKTLITELQNGDEYRNAEWIEARHSYGSPFENISRAAYRSLKTMFFACYGMTNAFRLVDELDSEADDEVFGIGDGVEDTFQLRKVSLVDGAEYNRNVYALPSNPVVTIDGVATTAFSINLRTGQLRFDTAPADTAVLRWTGSFDIWVRFATDSLRFSLDDPDATNGVVELIEVPPPNEPIP